MHKDTQEALERLEQELLAVEKPQLTEEDLDLLIEDILTEEDSAEIPEEPRNFANDYRAYNTDRPDLDLNSYSDEVYEEPQAGGGELVFATVMLGLITVVMVVWAVSML